MIEVKINFVTGDNTSDFDNFSHDRCLSHPTCDVGNMTERLQLFFAAVRRAEPNLRWSFHLATDGKFDWSEQMLKVTGPPPTRCHWVVIGAQCDVPNGFLTAQRAIAPGTAARYFSSQAIAVAQDVRAEFETRLPNFQPVARNRKS